MPLTCDGASKNSCASRSPMNTRLESYSYIPELNIPDILKSYNFVSIGEMMDTLSPLFRFNLSESCLPITMPLSLRTRSPSIMYLDISVTRLSSAGSIPRTTTLTTLSPTLIMPWPLMNGELASTCSVPLIRSIT